jgi:hypothetical protein
VAQDHRVEENGARLDYTCENYRFKTDVTQGSSHGTRSPSRGSFFDEPLVENGDGYTLWLEHVVEKPTQELYYWLMWYDRTGRPTVTMSSIMDRTDIGNMARLLTSFVP